MSGIDKPYFRKNAKDCAQQSYVIVERRNGQVHVSRRIVGGGIELLNEPPVKKKYGRKDGAWQHSRANGFVGDEKVLKKMMAMDAKLGVSINYRKTHEATSARGNRNGAYVAEFTDRVQKRKWLKAHKRYDLDASFKDPTPGTWQGSTPGEFQR
jgi:hypothetical protein